MCFMWELKRKCLSRWESLISTDLSLSTWRTSSTVTVVSEKKTVVCTNQQDIQTAELMVLTHTKKANNQDRTEMSLTQTLNLLLLQIDSKVMSRLDKHPERLLLVAESPAFSPRKMTRVKVSQHRGYIFIQTNQPMYNPKQKGKKKV